MQKLFTARPWPERVKLIFFETIMIPGAKILKRL